ncbi:MAG: hypothetical protein KAR07_06900 [Spirochaetes bacterium]|nr:hypothetical protein [Spirochaetota bacterium]
MKNKKVLLTALFLTLLLMLVPACDDGVIVSDDSSSSSSSSDVASSSSTAVSSSSTEASSSAPPASSSSAGAIKKVYSELSAGTDIFMDPSWQVWEGTVTIFNELSETGADSGTKIIQVVPNTSGLSWFGFTIRTASHAEDLSGYNYLIVNLRTTDMSSTAIEIGVGTPETDEHWFSVNMNGKTDGNWHKFVIDVSAVNLASVDWMFAMRNSDYSSGTVDFDNIYYSTVDPGDGETVTPPVYTKKKVYSEIANADLIPMDPSWQVWSGTITVFNELAETGADGGTKVIECVPNPGLGWFGFTIRTLSHAEDLSGYNYLVFSLRSTDINSTAVEIGVGTPDLTPSEEFWFSANMVGKTDGNWHQFVINLGAAGVNLASIDWMFAMRSGSYVGGNIDFDNVYYSTTAP